MHPDDAKAGGNTLKLGWQMLALGGHIQPKLPTPTVADQFTDNLKSSQHSDGSMHSVSLAQFVNRPDLLPTPGACDYKDGQAQIIRDGEVQTDTVARAVNELKGVWGKFEPVIRQWEQVTGREAPAPTQPDGKDGKHRLSPHFTEWLMGLPAGWITDANISRNEMLKACGNGVVPQQAALALSILLEGVEL